MILWELFYFIVGAIGGELSAELPFILMHPKPNMKKIMKADTMNDTADYKVCANCIVD